MNTVLTAAIALMVTGIAACSADSNAAVDLAGPLHACELLPGSEVERITGERVTKTLVGLESEQGKYAMSQCSYSLANFGQLTLQLTRSGKPIGVSRQADADRERARDDGTGFGVAMADAIESGADLPGLGSLAYQYRNDDAMHLVAYWDKHYSAWLWMNSDAAGEARVTQIEQDVARAVIQRLQAKQ